MNQILDTEDKFVSISRPRRFGKSMAAKMLVAYYSCGCDSYELFQNYEIAERDSFQQNLGLQIHLCCENKNLVCENVDAGGCLSQAVLENSLGFRFTVPKKKTARSECSCLLGADIGAYNSCGHGCLYCYANYDKETVSKNMRLHNPLSPLLIGEVTEEDIIKSAEQKSWKESQLDFFDFLQ